jgi:hypothetical protein
MKLNRYSLRQLIESVVTEGEFKSGAATMSFSRQDLNLGSEAGKTNKKARELTNEKSEEAFKFLKLKPRGRYYVYAADDGTMKLGSVRYSKGDPYTYESVGGGKYRVMSGPYDKNKYPDDSRRAGQIIGIRPIGAIFKPSSEPTVEVENTDLVPVNTAFVYNGKTSSDATVKSANDEISALISTSVAEGNPGMVPQRIMDFLNKSAGERKTSVAMLETLENNPFAFFGPGCNERQENLKELKEVFKDLGEMTGKRDVGSAADFITLRGLSVSGAGGEDVPTPGGGQAALEESLSRGSLLRRRYRRY